MDNRLKEGLEEGLKEKLEEGLEEGLEKKSAERLEEKIEEKIEGELEKELEQEIDENLDIYVKMSVESSDINYLYIWSIYEDFFRDKYDEKLYIIKFRIFKEKQEDKIKIRVKELYPDHVSTPLKKNFSSLERQIPNSNIINTDIPYSLSILSSKEILGSEKKEINNSQKIILKINPRSHITNISLKLIPLNNSQELESKSNDLFIDSTNSSVRSNEPHTFIP